MLKIFRVIIWNNTQWKREEVHEVQIYLSKKLLELYRKSDEEAYTSEYSSRYGEPQEVQVIYHYVEYPDNTRFTDMMKKYDPNETEEN